MTENQDYQPVSCQLHSELELAALQQRPVELSIETTNQSPPESQIGKIRDIVIRQGAEFVELVTDNQQTISIRLDHIKKIQPL